MADPIAATADTAPESDVSTSISSSSRRRARRRNRRNQSQLQTIQQQQVMQAQMAQQQQMYQPPPQQQQSGGGKDALSLRLDINLEAELTLKARVHGDVTLALVSDLLGIGN